MKTFDCDKAKESHGPSVIKLLKKYHTEPLSEQEFVDLFFVLPIRKDQKRSKARGPSRARQVYRSLKNGFGFFV